MREQEKNLNISWCLRFTGKVLIVLIDKLRLVVETMPSQNRCHKFDSEQIFGPE